MANDYSPEHLMQHQVSWVGLAQGFLAAATRRGIPAYRYRMLAPDISFSVEGEQVHLTVEVTSVLREADTDNPGVLLVRFSQHEQLLAQAAARLHWHKSIPETVKIEYIPDNSYGLTEEMIRTLIDTVVAASE